MPKPYKRKYELQQVLDAILGNVEPYLVEGEDGERVPDGCRGIVAVVARRLGCQWNTARKYIDLWATTKKAFEDELEQLLDFGESAMIKRIKEGDGQMIRYLLSTKGARRGYVERKEVTGKDGGPIQHNAIVGGKLQIIEYENDLEFDEAQGDDEGASL